MKESHIETEKKTELIIIKENAQISKQKKLKSRKLFVDTNEIEKKQKKKKYEDEENLAFDSKYSSKIKQEEDKIEKAKSSTSTFSEFLCFAKIQAYSKTTFIKLPAISDKYFSTSSSIISVLVNSLHN